MKGLKKWLDGLNKVVAVTLAAVVATATGLVALTGVVQQVVEQVECVGDVATGQRDPVGKPCVLSSNKAAPPSLQSE